MVIKTKHSEVIFGASCWESLNRCVHANSYSTVFILTDTNTGLHCLPHANAKIEFDYQTLDMQAGEENKHIQSCISLWDSLSEMGADRRSLLINIGGGVVTDLGGFVACTFKRGIDFINIPTSLLAMVDASVGGKTGIDLGALKNQVGIIKEPSMVLVDTDFLNTLPDSEYRSGYAEMLKHGLIQEPAYFEALSGFLSKAEILPHIHHSVGVKAKVVSEDIDEQGLRKILNFGHTLGHAVESHFLTATDKTTLLHGEAIAIGMILEAFLSVKAVGFPLESADKIKRIFQAIYPKVRFDKDTISEVIKMLMHDKKNENGNVLFVLLKTIGEPVWNQSVSEKHILEAFDFYQA